MIERTFQLTSGVGPWRERDLWARGVTTWDEFPPPGTVTMSVRLDEEARRRIELAKQALANSDLEALARMIPVREHWRLYERFSADAVFFDIECYGGGERDEPTVVSLFDADGLSLFIADRNL